MKKRQRKSTKIGLILLILAILALAFLPLQAWAAVDTDGDGILDKDDSTPNVLGDGDCLPKGSVCPDTGKNPNTDPNKADLFVILGRPTTGSILNQFDFDPLEFIKNKAQVVFNMTLHEIGFQDPPDYQKVTEEQKAVALSEDLNTSDGDLGTSQIGVPVDGRTGKVFTYRIRDDIVKACSRQNPALCTAVNADGALKASGMDNIFQFYAKNVVAHEIFHMVNRVVPAINADNHYPQLGYIMDHNMYYKEYKKTKNVVWIITDKWSNADNPQYK
jgi:hypothetical protein